MQPAKAPSVVAELPFTAWCEVLWVVLKVRRALKRHGFGPTWERLQTDPQQNYITSRAGPLQVSRAVALVATLLPCRVRCLEQALASYMLLRPTIADITVRIGVTPHGFRAHAWVEVSGQPLNENADYLRTLGVFQLPT
jgi:Transglutaminase-like superfamily